MVKVIKRNLEQVDFNKDKITNAILKAMKYGSGRVDEVIASRIAVEVEDGCKSVSSITIQDIEKMVFNLLCKYGHEDTARAYEGYRAIREYRRTNNTTDIGVLELIKGENSDLATENSNKDVRINSTQRDYIAGEVSKDLTRRKLLPPHIVQAHDEGILHFHK